MSQNKSHQSAVSQPESDPDYIIAYQNVPQQQPQRNTPPQMETGGIATS